MEVWRSGDVFAVDATCMYRGMEVWRCVATVATWWYGGMDALSSGYALQLWRDGGMEVWRYRALEMCCSYCDMVVWRYGALGTRRSCGDIGIEVCQLWRRVAAVARWWYGGMKV